MPTSLEITFEQLGRLFEESAHRVQALDLSQAMRTIAVMVKSSIKERFATGTAPDGSTWLPLKRPRQGKRHKNSSPLPLRDTGLLMASVTSSGPYHFERIGANFVEVGTNLEYSGLMQHGGDVHFPERSRKKPWVFQSDSGDVIFTRHIRAHTVHVPARPFLGWSDSLIEETVEVLGEYLEKALWP